MIIIALTGQAGAGKDTVADVLATHAGFTKLAFADALRAEVANGFELGDQYGILSDRATKEQPHPLLALQRCKDIEALRVFRRLWEAVGATMDAPDEMHAPRSPRQIMQWWGTEYRRAQQPNYWSTKVAMRIAQMHSLQGVERFVVTDARFENEAAAMRVLGGQVWQVMRPGLVSAEGTHASATDGSRLRPDCSLLNGGGILDLAHASLRMLQYQYGGIMVNVSEAPAGAAA